MNQYQISNIKYQNDKLKFKIFQKGNIFLFAFWFVILIFDICILNLSYAQQIVSSTELIERAKELDGQEVVYQGEAIGEVMTRKDYSWLNINDGENAIGIWMENKFLSQISFCGSYNARGDWLEVKGIFNRACRIHGGDLDIHGSNITKIREGKLVKHRLAEGKQKIVIILAGVFLCLLMLQLLKKKQKVK